MTFALDSLGPLFKSNVDATRRCTVWALNGMERIVKLQLDTMETVYAETTKALQASLPMSDSLASASRWSAPLEESAQRSVDLMRAYSGAASHWQAELKQILEEQEAALNRHLVESVEEFVDLAGIRDDRSAAERRREPAHAERKSHKLAA